MKTITAEEFLKQKDEALGTLWTDSDEDICKTFIEFAKLHCIEQARVISENAKTKWNGEFIEIPIDTITIDKDSILNAYSLDLIK